MLAFDDWADWLRSKGEAFAGNGVSVTYRDTRAIPECASNPAFGLDVETSQRLGTISFWRNGLCDYQVFDTSTEQLLVDERMLDANDKTVPNYVARFLSFLGEDAS